MRRGFTMIEVMGAGAILAIGCLGILAMLLTTIDYNRQAHLRTQAVTLAEQQIAKYASAANNWRGSTTPPDITTLQQMITGHTDGKWTTPQTLNVNGADVPSTATNHAPRNQFAVAYTFLQSTGTNQIRGAIRVIWNRKNGANCLTANAFTQTNTVTQQSSQCGFVTLPFAFKKDAYAELE